MFLIDKMTSINSKQKLLNKKTHIYFNFSKCVFFYLVIFFKAASIREVYYT